MFGLFKKKVRHVKNWVLNVNNVEPMLHKQLFDVPMRLFIYNEENKEFRKLLKGIISYMKRVLETKFEEYPETKGISGANVGIPYNIVLVKKGKKVLTFINPKMMPLTDEQKEVKSNCGSILLQEPIKIKRYKKISVAWYDLNGNYHMEDFRGRVACTLQHEIEHNLGILITDKEER
jgi:peptide deformylase